MFHPCQFRRVYQDRRLTEQNSVLLSPFSLLYLKRAWYPQNSDCSEDKGQWLSKLGILGLLEMSRNMITFPWNNRLIQYDHWERNNSVFKCFHKLSVMNTEYWISDGWWNVFLWCLELGTHIQVIHSTLTNAGCYKWQQRFHKSAIKNQEWLWTKSAKRYFSEMISSQEGAQVSSHFSLISGYRNVNVFC